MKTREFESLFDIIKKEFFWCIINNIVDIHLLLKVKKQANKNNIFIRGDGNDKYFKEDSTVNFIIMFPDIGICSNWGNNGSRYYKTI
jgi:hypothetical protein